MPDPPDAPSAELRRVFASDCATGVDDFLARASAADRDAVVAALEAPPDRSGGDLQTAIHIAGRMGEPRAAPLIAALLPDLDERGRINALSALGAIGGREAEDAIVRAGDDPSPDVRRFVVHALSRIATDAARRRLDELAAADPVDFVRLAAHRAPRP
jgi:HEAT repeat protein